MRDRHLSSAVVQLDDIRADVAVALLRPVLTYHTRLPPMRAPIALDARADCEAGRRARRGWRRGADAALVILAYLVGVRARVRARVGIRARARARVRARVRVRFARSASRLDDDDVSAR